MIDMSYLQEESLIDCLTHLGRGQSPSYVDEESTVLAVNQKCVRNSAVDITYARFHNSKVNAKENAVLKKGDICINSTGTGTIGRVGLWDLGSQECGTQYFADSHVTIARPDEKKVNPKYLAALLESAPIQTSIETYCFSGSTNQVELNRTELSDLILPLIPREAQNVVATILSTIDQAIAQTEAIIAKQQRIKTGLMQDLLTKGIDEAGNVRSEATHEFKDSAIGRIPIEWEVESFGNRVKESAFGPRFSSTAYSKEGNFALLRTTDVDVEGEIRYKQMPLAKLPELEFYKHILQKNDLLITRSGTCGVTSVFKEFVTPTIPGAFSIRFRLCEELVSPDYVKIYFNWEQGRKMLLDLAEGGVQKNIRGSAINQMLFAFPSIDEQYKILESLTIVHSKIESDRNVLNKFKLHKTGLMQDLLTGKVRVTDLLEAPP
jgi:type I restriction enzyme, S subunit